MSDGKKIHRGFFSQGDETFLSPDCLTDIMEKAFSYKCRDGFVLKGHMMLHGICDIFCDALHERFGYPQRQISDEYGNLVHSFCVKRKGGRTFYIDARGITTEYSDIVDAFDDWVGDKEKYAVHKYDVKNREYYPNDYYEDALKGCREMVGKYSSYYDVGLVRADRISPPKKRGIREDGREDRNIF